jgi:hypothetical protein
MGVVGSTDFTDYTDFCSAIRRWQILTTEDTGNTEGEERGFYNDGSDGSEGGGAFSGVAFVAAVVVGGALCPLCSPW